MIKFRVLSTMAMLAGMAGIAAGQSLDCDLHAYKAMDGLKAEESGNALEMTWQGEGGQQLRAAFTIRNGQPVVQELAARAGAGAWIVLGKDLSPEFQVSTGKRRISNAQRTQMKALGIDTPEQENVRKWNTFWDAPLVMPGGGDTTDLPRTAAEITRGSSSYNSNSCQVVTNGSRLSATFNGLTLGIFSGNLRFTVYKGSNLLRQEAVAKTDRPDVAYIYKAGLKGFTIQPDTKLAWRDNAQHWQNEYFGERRTRIRSRCGRATAWKSLMWAPAHSQFSRLRISSFSLARTKSTSVTSTTAKTTAPPSLWAFFSLSVVRAITRGALPMPSGPDESAPRGASGIITHSTMRLREPRSRWPSTTT